MQPSSDSAFDFERWAALAKADAASFEAQRAQMIDALIAGSSPRNQARLRGLQWQIDVVRGRAGSPLSSCVRMFNRMWESVYGERGLLEALRTVDGPPLRERTSGEIVELHATNRAQRHDKISRSFLHP
jgi:hypothetical protein